MDTPTPTDPRVARSFRSQHARTQGGQALVIVLSFMMLMVVLVLVFFGSVQTDSLSARSSNGGVAARQLAQSAVQIVEGTISQATVPGADNTIAWASQPGMIRTYGGGGVASGTPLNYYKLYSSSQMVVKSPNTSGFSPDADVVSNWDTEPSMYTDLNSPLTDSSGNLVYPIVDPRAQDAATAVEGFSYSNQTSSGTSVDGVSTSGTESLPMPVQWLYVLQDGSLVSPTAANTTSVTFSGTGVPTASNPIVGRVGFWTDDECAKVNLNTASEGTFWDTPVTLSGTPTDVATNPMTASGDMELAVSQADQHEFQRYPGHPATTCLSTVFGASLSSDRATMVRTLTTASPRANDLDSPDNTSSTFVDTSLGGTQIPSNAFTPLKFDRLYASVDDYNFTPSRTVQALGSSSSTSQQIIQRSRFFITTNSKASSLNPFGLPKVSIWPIWDDSDAGMRSPLDKAILRGATLSPAAASGSQHVMNFVRSDWTSPTNDYANYLRNQQLYGYLQSLTSLPIPGFGGTFSTKWGTSDRDQVLTEIFDYIRCTNLADQSVSTSDSYSTTTSSLAGAGSPAGFHTGEVVPITINSTHGFGRVPIVAELALMFKKMDDRSNTSNQTGEGPVATTINVTGGPDIAGNTFPSTCSPASETLVEWSLFPRILSVACGYPALANDICIHFLSINLTIGATTLSYSNSGSTATQIPDEYDIGRLATTGRDSDVGGNVGYMSLLEPSSSMIPTGLVKVTGLSGAPMALSGTIHLQVFAPSKNTANPIQDITFAIPTGTTVPIPTWSTITQPAPTTPPAAPATPNYTYSSAVRGGVTYIAPSPTVPAGQGTLTYHASTLAFAIAKSGTNGPTGQDTTRSLCLLGQGSLPSPAQGDMRTLALSQSAIVDSTGGSQNLFQISNLANGSAPTASTAQTNSMRAGNGIVGWSGFAAGMLFQTVSGTNDSGSSAASGPEVPVLSNGTKLIPPHIGASGSKIPADWDNAFGVQNDGPYINRPDEGVFLASGPVGSTTVQENIPYLGNYETLTNAGAPTVTTFSPNRQVASPVTFGSLPIGADHPWQTLLFRPAFLPGYQELQAGTPGYQHPGGTDPTIPDHLLLDFFRMPVVEPYTESDALSTMGQVNLNTQIVPFTYIKRTTGLRAVLKSVMITAISNLSNGAHKSTYYFGNTESLVNASVGTLTTRYPIDRDNTIALLYASPDSNSNLYNAYPEFNRTTYTPSAPNFFISPSQICDLPLIPSIVANASGANSMKGIVSSPITTLTGGNSLETFWANNYVTGDNELERPYSLIYPRVTTQSNTFTVHVRAQSLKQVAADVKASTWTEGKSAITGEYRGSFTVEKYFDPTYAVITKTDGTISADTDDASVTTGSAVRGDNYSPASPTGPGSATLQHGALWRLLENRRFGG